MSNSTPVINIRDTLSQFLARVNQFDEANSLLVQGKVNKSLADGEAQPRFPAGESNSRALAQWFNMMDDFVLNYFTLGGGQLGAFQEVYRIDFREVTNASLNNLGSVVVIDGVNWRTPQNAASNDVNDMSLAVGDYGITDAGLELVNGALNTRMDGNARSCNFVWANLFDIGNNSKTPFTVDPSSKWRFEVYVSEQTNPVSDIQHTGVAIYRTTEAVEPLLPGVQALWRSGLGFADAAADTATGGGGTGPTTVAFRHDLTPSVASITHHSGNTKDLMSGIWNGVDDDFPAAANLQWLASPPDPTDEQGIVMDSRFGFRVAPYHCNQSGTANYGAVIQQLRILRG